LLPRVVTPPPSPAAPSGSSEMAMAGACGEKKRLEIGEERQGSAGESAMEKRGGRPSSSFLFLGPPGTGARAGGLGADTAAEAPRRNPSRRCGDRGIGFQILKRLGGDGEWRETGNSRGEKSAAANPVCAAPWFAFSPPGAPVVCKYGIRNAEYTPISFTFTFSPYTSVQSEGLFRSKTFWILTL
jgi:hypothetical protein